MRHTRPLALGICVCTLGLAAPALAGDVHSSDGVKDHQACGTTASNTPVTTCYTGSTAIQDAANAAGGGGTVNVGKGTFGPVTLSDGITLLGSGHDTIIAGTVSEPNTSLIYAFASAPGFSHPLRISSINLSATAAPGTRGNEITLRDQNRDSLDTITNTWFTVASGSQGSVRGLYTYNSYAPLVLTRSTFSRTQDGILLETGGGTGTMFGASSINYNLFDHLKRAPAPLGFVTAIQVSIDNPGPMTAGAQDFSRNNFVFDDSEGTTGLEVNGHGMPSDNGLPTTIGFHSNNLDHTDLGVLNETEGQLSATDTWWGCPTGPDVNPAMGAGSNGCAELVGDPAVTFWTPWLTSKAPISVGATG
jgi:hypothetical protein